MTDRLPEIGMVVLQPTGFCNIACTYCYLPDRDTRHVMAQSTVRRIFEEVFCSGWASPEMIVLWHAGEPMAAPINFYREAFSTIAALCPPTVRLKHSFQTNATLVTDDWCRLLLEWNVGVGVSVDGPREVHDSKRRTRGGRGTFDKTMAGIRCLQRNGVPFHVLTVLGQSGLSDPDGMVSFYESADISKVCFNVEETEGSYVSELFYTPREELRRQFAIFLRRFWHRAREGGKISFVREIDQLMPRLFRPEGIEPRNIQAEPLAMLNVDSHGNVSTFSPELLGLQDEAYGDYILGNITLNSLNDIYVAALSSSLYRDIRAGVEACASTCGYYSVCGGGSPVNKLFECGSFRATQTSFCTLTQMVPTDLLLEAYDRLEHAWPTSAASFEANSPATADRGL